MFSQLSAHSFCTLCYWAHKANMPGRVEAYAKRPGAPSGHYQRHLNKTLGFDERRSTNYKLGVVGHRRHDLDRCRFDMPVQLPYECLERELEQDPSITVRLHEAIVSRALPPTYYDNPVVQSTSDEVLPTALFIDGVPYSQTDSAVGVWLINLVTGSRHMIALIRKRITCKCGCRGWDTFFPLFQYLAWALRVMAEGVFPATRHDGTAWGHSDANRQHAVGRTLRAKAVLLHIKGDWVEFCQQFGFPTWSSGFRPCFCCAASGDRMYTPIGLSVVALPWYINTDEDYDRACKRCEHYVVLSAHQHAYINTLLWYDKRERGNHGRCLANDPVGAPELGLRVGDRLEPTAFLPDVAAFGDITTFPTPQRGILFWRSSDVTICTRRNPLFDRELGVTPTRSIAIDLLHTLFLGPMHTWCRMVVWRLLSSGLWGTIAASESERVQVGVLCLRAELMAWYAARRRALSPAHHVTELSDLTVKMVGTATAPRLKTKAMETFGLLLFLTEMLLKNRDRFDDADRLIESGEVLARLVALMRESEAQLRPAVLQDPTPR